MKYLIIGAGAIGSLVGGKLAQQGHDVLLVGRVNFANQVSQHGLTIIDAGQRQTLKNVIAVESLMAATPLLADGAEYSAIVTVKGYDTANVCLELHAAQLRPSAILSLQNGVGNEELLAQQFDQAEIIAGVINTPVSVESTGVIVVEKAQYAIGISPLSLYEGALNESLHIKLERDLQQAGFEVRCYPDARSLKWTKLLMNMVGNASSAILDATPAEVFAQDALADMEIDAWREALAVMRAAGIAPINLGSYPFKLLAPLIRWLPKTILRPLLRKQVGGARGGKMPSLHIDLAAGKPQSEVITLNGAVVKMGKEVQIATPVNDMLDETLSTLVADPALGTV